MLRFPRLRNAQKIASSPPIFPFGKVAVGQVFRLEFYSNKFLSNSGEAPLFTSTLRAAVTLADLGIGHRELSAINLRLAALHQPLKRTVNLVYCLHLEGATQNIRWLFDR